MATMASLIPRKEQIAFPIEEIRSNNGKGAAV
jgi:hypothetical protein